MALGPSSAVPAPIEAALARLVPRSNVTPRGEGYTAKLSRDGAVEYLGIFESPEEAQLAYDHAAREWELQVAGADGSGSIAPPRPPRPFSVQRPTGAFLARRDAWLAAPAPAAPEPLRAARLCAGPADVAVLRELAGPYLEERRGAFAAAAAAAGLPPGQTFAATPGDGAEEPAAPEREDDEAKPRKRARKPKAPKAVPLYNKVVSVVDLPPCYAAHKYWFVYQYVPDMAFCHLCPLETFGTFGKNSKREGRPRWRLVPEGEAREIDVSASRCVLVKHHTVAKTPSADKEIFDITDQPESVYADDAELDELLDAASDEVHDE